MRSLLVLLTVVLCAGAAAAGAASAPAHHAPVPVAVKGVLHDTAGKPVVGASVQLTATDAANAKPGQRIPIHLLARTRTDAAGRFTLRQSPSTRFIRKLAAENGGWVNFQLWFRARGKFMPWSIPRKASRGGWLAEDNPNVPAALKVERLTFKASGR